MKHDFSADIAAVQAVDDVREILRTICDITGMGFAAVARVTDTRWIACQVLDRIGFGLDAGDELELQTTICDEIRQSGSGVIIDHVADNPQWRTHHTPVLYGFQSYISLPIRRDDSFFGTLCAIDPEPRNVSSLEVVTMFENYARDIGTALSVRAIA